MPNGHWSSISRIKASRSTKLRAKRAFPHLQRSRSSRSSNGSIQSRIDLVAAENGRRLIGSIGKSSKRSRRIGVYQLFKWPLNWSGLTTSSSLQKRSAGDFTRPNSKTALPARSLSETARHMKARLRFAQQHKDKPLEFWRKILWSDESKFNLVSSDGPTKVWRWQGEAYKLSCMRGTVKFGGGNVMSRRAQVRHA